jgi:hypothetical protein
MGLLSRAAQGLGRRAIKTGNSLNGLMNYLMITGGLGGAAGGLMAAGDEEAYGGTPEQINEAALHGAGAGAAGGPLAFGPAVAMTMAGGPAGAMPIVPWALYTGTEGQRPRRERERKAMEEEAIRRALMERLQQMHGRGGY